MDYKVTWDFHGLEIRGYVEASPGRPGRTSGPPEHCYEAEPPEIYKITDAEYWSDDARAYLPFPRDLWESAWFQEVMADAALEAWCEMAADIESCYREQERLDALDDWEERQLRRLEP